MPALPGTSRLGRSVPERWCLAATAFILKKPFSQRVAVMLARALTACWALEPWGLGPFHSISLRGGCTCKSERRAFLVQTWRWREAQASPVAYKHLVRFPLRPSREANAVMDAQ